MTDFPKTARETRHLAIELVRHLKNGIRNTDGPQHEWKARNFALLHEFCHSLKVDPIYSGRETGPESLWDFVGYIKTKGNLITAESEFDTDPVEIAKDFDKLLYGSSPIKLMICRIDTKYWAQGKAEGEAERIRALCERNIKENCTNYPPGSVFVVYCVWWAEKDGPNRDFPFLLQIEGEPIYQDAIGKKLEPVSWTP